MTTVSQVNNLTGLLCYTVTEQEDV